MSNYIIIIILLAYSLHVLVNEGVSFTLAEYQGLNTFVLAMSVDATIIIVH